jgi:hypothetical protein
VHLEEVHLHSYKNKDSVKNSKKCGCFNCCQTFDSSKVTKFTSDEEHSAICPLCGHDTVLPDFDVKLSDNLLNDMYEEYIGED